MAAGASAGGWTAAGLSAIQRVTGGWRNGDDGPRQDVPPSDEGRSGDLGPPPEIFREGLGGGGEPPAEEGDGGEQPRRRWPAIVGIGTVVLVLILLIQIGVGVFVDRLWFAELGYRGVFDTRIGTQVWLFFAGFGIALAVIGGSLYAAWRIPLEELAERVEVPGLSRLIAVAGVIAALLLAIIFGTIASGQWELILQYLNAEQFGVEDPQFGRDIGFYVFSLDALQFVRGWATGLIIVALLGTLAIYGVRLLLHRGAVRSTLPARLHVAVLMAITLGLFVWSYWLGRLELAVSPGGFVFGATYTDDNVRGPVQVVKMVIAVVAIGAVMAWPFHERLRLAAVPLIAVAAVSIVGSLIVPAAVQRFTVEPNELERETPYIARNIEATRAAFGLDLIEEREFAANDALSDADLAQNPEALDNVRLWDHRPLRDTLNTIQTIRPLYLFHDVDVDRYVAGGEEQQVFVAARELSQANLQPNQQSWVNRRLQYTHGFGVAMTPVDVVTSSGEPELWISNIPPEVRETANSGALDIEVVEPRIYYGEETDSYVIANSNTEEFDYPLSADGTGDEGQANQATTRYSGDGGVRVGGFLRRLVFAWEFADTNILISGSISGNSRILFRRLIQERVSTLAPFLSLDDDPYIVVGDDGRLYWIQDAYTSTEKYPYSQPHDAGFNYIRNSVKAVIDAYHGTVDLYVVDPDDPIIKVWSNVFPDLFKPASDFPADLVAHWRYPQDLFQIQSDQYITYHLDSPRDIFTREDLWAIPQELFQEQQINVEPYYVTLRLPDEERAEFLLILPFTPRNRINSIAWLAGRSDGDHYGKLFAFRFPANKNVDGPLQIENRIDQDVDISRQFTLLGQQGSEVIRGNLLFVPVGSSYVYVEPIYLRAENGRFPQLKAVIVVNGDTIAYEDTFAEAVQVALGRRADGGADADAVAEEAEDEPPPARPSPPEEVTSSDAGELADEAQRWFDEAMQRLQAGDFAGYGEAIAQLGAVLERLQAVSE